MNERVSALVVQHIYLESAEVAISSVGLGAVASAVSALELRRRRLVPQAHAKAVVTGATSRDCASILMVYRGMYVCMYVCGVCMYVC